MFLTFIFLSIIKWSYVSPCRRNPSGLRGVPVVSVGLVQREVRRLGRETPHTLRADALGQPRDGLPPAGGGEEVHPRQLLMTRPGTEGGKGEKGEDEAEG